MRSNRHEKFSIGAGFGAYEIGDDQFIGRDVRMLLGEYGPEKWSAGGPYYEIGADINQINVPPGVDRQSMRAALAQKLAQSGTVVREKEPTKSRQYAIPFDSVATIAAGATLVITSSPQVLFRPERLVVSAAIAPSFVINDFKVGKNSQFATSGSHPADAFAPNAFGIRLKCDTAQISHLIALSVTNISAGALRFLASVFGEAVE